MDPRFLEMSPLHQLKAEGAWLFPKLRLVEVYLAFFRVWLRRELQRGKYAHLRLSAEEWDEKVVKEEEQYLGFCRRLAFAMFKRGVTSWTMHREYEQAAEPVATAAQVKVNRRRQQAKQTAKVCAHCVNWLA